MTCGDEAVEDLDGDLVDAPCRTAGLDARPRRPRRRTPRDVDTRARRAWRDPGAGGRVAWHRLRIWIWVFSSARDDELVLGQRLGPSSGGDRGRGPARPWRRSRDREGRSSCAGSRAAARPRAASARSSTPLIAATIPAQHVAPQLGAAEAGERQAKLGRQLTGQGLHLRDDPRGKKRRVGLRGDAPPAPRAVLERSACATCSRRAVACRVAPRSPCSRGPRRREARSWRAPRPDTVTYTAGLSLRESGALWGQHDGVRAVAWHVQPPGYHQDADAPWNASLLYVIVLMAIGTSHRDGARSVRRRGARSERRCCTGCHASASP